MINDHVREYLLDPLLDWLNGQYKDANFSQNVVHEYCSYLDVYFPNVFSECLSDAEARGYIDGFHDKFAVSFYRLTEVGIAHIEHKSGDKKSVLGMYHQFGYSWLHSALVNIFESHQEVPASDRTVTLNHNQPDYQDALETLEKAIEEFDRDHSLDNELGPEKGALRKSLEAARGYLQLNEINLRIGIAMVVEPLRYLAKKYEMAITNAALGELFRLAADKVMALFN